MMLQGELEDERRACKQQGERADLAHKALGDKQAQLDLASQRITAADVASDEAKSKIQVMLLTFDIFPVSCAGASCVSSPLCFCLLNYTHAISRLVFDYFFIF